MIEEKHNVYKNVLRMIFTADLHEKKGGLRLKQAGHLSVRKRPRNIKFTKRFADDQRSSRLRAEKDTR